MSRTPSFSLREFLSKQGVTDEMAMRRHIMFVMQMYSGRKLEMDRYRVNPENPNSFPPMMG